MAKEKEPKEEQPKRDLEKEVDALAARVANTRKAVCLLAELVIECPLPIFRKHLDDIHALVKDL